MNEIASAAAFVASPCIGTCRMRADGSVCEGCLRTLDEIAAWGGATDAQRRIILTNAGQRQADAAN